MVQTLHDRHADIELEITDASARELDNMLLADEIEVAVYCMPDREFAERLHALPLFREQMMIVVPPSHRLANQNAIRVKDLDGESYVNRSKCEFNGYAGQFFAEQGVSCRTVYRSERDDWVLAMVRSGLGFGFMPEFSVIDQGVVARPLIDPEFWRLVNLVTVRGRPHSPAVGALVREAMRVKWQGQEAVAVTRARKESGLVAVS
jgi:DNA-binding transcriptional LysR family regulator